MKHIIENGRVKFENGYYYVGALVPYVEYDKGDERHIKLRDVNSVRELGSVKTPLGEAEKISVTTENEDITLVTDFFVGEEFGMYFSQRVENKSGEVIMLRRLGADDKNDPFRSSVFRPSEITLGTINGESVGGCGIDYAYTKKYDETMLIYADGGKTGVFCTAVNLPNANIFMDVETKWGHIEFDVYSDMCCIVLDPGETREGQDIAFIDLSYDEAAGTVARNYEKFLGKRDKYPVLTGWCSWYSVNMNVNEEYVLDVVDWFGENTDRYKPDFVQIDDGFQVRRGDWECNERFPNGFSEINRRISEIGAMPGIWLSPNNVHSDCKALSGHPEWVARCENDPEPFEGDCVPSLYDLDTTNPEVKEYIRGVLETKMKEGFTYFKIDFNNIHTCGYTSYNKKMTSMQAYRELYRFYREVLGDNYLLACVGDCKRGTIGFADGARMGTDSCAHYEAFPLCIRNTLRMVPNRYYLKDLICLDPDVTYLAPKWESLTEDERKIWHSFVGIYGGLVQFSEIRERIEKYTHQLEIMYPPCREVAKTVHPITDPDNTRIGFNAKRDYGNFGVYLMWNNAARAWYENTDLSAVLGEPGEKFHVFSFWDEEYLGVHCADFTIEDFKPRHAYLFRFTPVGQPVCVIGTTTHLSMGATDIDGFAYDGRTAEIKLAERGAGRGSIYLYSEKKVVSSVFDGCDGEVTQDGSLVRVKLVTPLGGGKIILETE